VNMALIVNFSLMMSTYIACCVMTCCGIARIVVGGSVALGWVHSKHPWHGGAGSVD
jgi:hypothetical protein